MRTYVPTKQEREEALTWLKENLPLQTTVYTILRKVSANGMMRYLSLYIVKDGTVWDITRDVVFAFGDNLSEYNGSWILKVGGAGMDMGFHAVTNLSHLLFGYRSPGDETEETKNNAYGLNHKWL